MDNLNIGIAYFENRQKANRIKAGGELRRKDMFRIKGEEIHQKPKGESHSFCMNLVPLLHTWSDGIISLGDRATSRHLEVPSSPHFKRILSIWY